MIKLTNVCKSFACGHAAATALRGIDLAVDRGEFVAVTGPSGCGKTTLLNIVGLLDAPSSGCYTFDDEDLRQYTAHELTELRKRHIGFIFQSFQLLDDLTVYENVELPLRYQRAAHRRRPTLVREALELVALESRAKAYPDELSGGEQQRVAVARALVNDPDLLLADEPTGKLDGESGAEILDMLVTLNGIGTTVLMATHSLSCATRAGRVVRLHDGRMAGPRGDSFGPAGESLHGSP